MARNPVSFRLSDDALRVLDVHTSDLAGLKARDVDRTEALEDILRWFDTQTAGVLARLKKRASEFRRRPAHYAGNQKHIYEYLPEVSKDQLEEALH